VMEQVAPTIDLWHWKGDVVPFQNYLAWFVLAFLFHVFLKIRKVKFENRMAFMIFVCQFLFFFILFVTFKLTT
jgi:bisanhydrobacterioruberin hydratase